MFLWLEQFLPFLSVSIRNPPTIHLSCYCLFYIIFMLWLNSQLLPESFLTVTKASNSGPSILCGRTGTSSSFITKSYLHSSSTLRCRTHQEISTTQPYRFTLNKFCSILILIIVVGWVFAWTCWRMSSDETSAVLTISCRCANRRMSSLTSCASLRRRLRRRCRLCIDFWASWTSMRLSLSERQSELEYILIKSEFYD